MSELLRAIFDKNCVDSRTAFYTAQFFTAFASSTRQLVRRQASIPCRPDVWFLAMGAVYDAARIGGGFANWTAKSSPFTFQIQRASNGEVYSVAPQLMVLQNYNLNNFVTMDEYILFPPAELIQINADIAVSEPAPYTSEFSFVTLMGVEYQMPHGKGPNDG